MKWYYAKNNTQHGPVDDEEFHKLIDNQIITPYDLVWNETMDEWTPASDVPGLFPGFISTPYPVPTDIITDTKKLTDNKELQLHALEALQGNWNNAVGIYLLYFIIVYSVSFIPYVGDVIPVIIGGPFMLGMHIFYLNLARNKPAFINQLFDGFKLFEQAFFANVLITVFTLLWALFFIIPGIMAALSYSMTFFILYDNPDIQPHHAIAISKKMMTGHKKKLFYLQCRFIPWILLTILTMGIGFFWLYPYMMTAHAKFYEDLRQAQTVQ